MEDTLWNLVVTNEATDGSVGPVQNGDDEYVEEGEEVCYYLVGVDEYGNMIYDDDGDPLILEDLGCWIE
jgi:hypothetical protein